MSNANKFTDVQKDILYTRGVENYKKNTREKTHFIHRNKES